VTIPHHEEVSSGDVHELIAKTLKTHLKVSNEIGSPRMKLYVKPKIVHTHCPVPGAGEPDSVEFPEEDVDYEFVDNSLALVYRGIEIYWALKDDGSHYEYWYALYSGASENGDELDIRDWWDDVPDKYEVAMEWVTHRHQFLSDTNAFLGLCYGIDADLVNSDEVPTHFENVTKCRKAKRHNKVKDKDGFCSYCLTES